MADQDVLDFSDDETEGDNARGAGGARTRTWETPPNQTAEVGLRELAERWRLPPEEEEAEEEAEEEEAGPAGPLFGRTETPIHKKADEALAAFNVTEKRYAAGAKKIRAEATAILKSVRTARAKIQKSVAEAGKRLSDLEKRAASKKGTVVDIKVHRAKFKALQADSAGWLASLLEYEQWANGIIASQNGDEPRYAAAEVDDGGGIRQVARTVALGPNEETGTQTNATEHEIALVSGDAQIELAGRLPGGATYREKIAPGATVAIAAGSQYNIKNRDLRRTVLTFVSPQQ